MGGRNRTKRTAAAMLLATVLVVPRARAGNLDTFPLSNDAALDAQTETAVARSSSAVWYNPAGIGTARASSIDVNASGYLLRFGGTPSLQAAPGVPSTERKLSPLYVLSVPSALSYSRRIGGLDVGIGLYVPNRSVLFPRTTVRAQPPSGGRAAELTIDGNERFDEYYGGLAFGRELVPGFRLGFSVFGYYSSEVNTSAVGASLGSGSGVPEAILVHQTIDEQRVGLQVAWGLQWQFLRSWRVGLVLRSPVFQLYRQTQTIAITTAASATSPPQYSLDFSDDRALHSLQLRPMRAHLGLARSAGRTTLAGEVSIQAPQADLDPSRASATVWDVRLGGRAVVARNIRAGGGVFTDRSPTRQLQAGTNVHIDYYGLSAGLEFGSSYLVIETDGVPSRRPASMRMTTTVAFSYSVGLGRLQNSALDIDSGHIVLRPVQEDVVAHEFMLHIGGTLIE